MPSLGDRMTDLIERETRRGEAVAAQPVICVEGERQGQKFVSLPLEIIQSFQPFDASRGPNDLHQAI